MNKLHLQMQVSRFVILLLGWSACMGSARCDGLSTWRPFSIQQRPRFVRRLQPSAYPRFVGGGANDENDPKFKNSKTRKRFVSYVKKKYGIKNSEDAYTAKYSVDGKLLTFREVCQLEESHPDAPSLIHIPITPVPDPKPLVKQVTRIGSTIAPLLPPICALPVELLRLSALYSDTFGDGSFLHFLGSITEIPDKVRLHFNKWRQISDLKLTSLSCDSNASLHTPIENAGRGDCLFWCFAHFFPKLFPSKNPSHLREIFRRLILAHDYKLPEQAIKILYADQLRGCDDHITALATILHCSFRLHTANDLGKSLIYTIGNGPLVGCIQYANHHFRVLKCPDPFSPFLLPKSPLVEVVELTKDSPSILPDVNEPISTQASVVPPVVPPTPNAVHYSKDEVTIVSLPDPPSQVPSSKPDLEFTAQVTEALQKIKDQTKEKVSAFTVSTDHFHWVKTLFSTMGIDPLLTTAFLSTLLSIILSTYAAFKAQWKVHKTHFASIALSVVSLVTTFLSLLEKAGLSVPDDAIQIIADSAADVVADAPLAGLSHDDFEEFLTTKPVTEIKSLVNSYNLQNDNKYILPGDNLPVCSDTLALGRWSRKFLAHYFQVDPSDYDKQRDRDDLLEFEYQCPYTLQQISLQPFIYGGADPMQEIIVRMTGKAAFTLHQEVLNSEKVSKAIKQLIKTKQPLGIRWEDIILKVLNSAICWHDGSKCSFTSLTDNPEKTYHISRQNGKYTLYLPTATSQSKYSFKHFTLDKLLNSVCTRYIFGLVSAFTYLISAAFSDEGIKTHKIREAFTMAKNVNSLSEGAKEILDEFFLEFTPEQQVRNKVLEYTEKINKYMNASYVEMHASMSLLEEFAALLKEVNEWYVSQDKKYSHMTTPLFQLYNAACAARSAYYQNMCKSSIRARPPAIVVWGKSHVGKSEALRHLAHSVGYTKIKNYDPSRDFIAHQSVSKYWNQTNGERIWFFDEAGSAADVADELFFSNIRQFCSSDPFVLPTAALTGKQNLCLAEMAFVTMNIDPNTFAVNYAAKYNPVSIPPMWSRCAVFEAVRNPSLPPIDLTRPGKNTYYKDFSHIQFQRYCWDERTGKMVVDGKPISFGALQKLCFSLYDTAQLDLAQKIAQKESLANKYLAKTQSARVISIVLHGPSGSGKSFCVDSSFLQDLSRIYGLPIVNISGTNISQSFTKPSLFICDDYLLAGIDELQERAKRFSEFYDKLPSGSVVISCTNISPKGNYRRTFGAIDIGGCPRRVGFDVGNVFKNTAEIYVGKGGKYYVYDSQGKLLCSQLSYMVSSFSWLIFLLLPFNYFIPYFILCLIGLFLLLKYHTRVWQALNGTTFCYSHALDLHGARQWIRDFISSSNFSEIKLQHIDVFPFDPEEATIHLIADSMDAVKPKPKLTENADNYYSSRSRFRAVSLPWKMYVDDSLIRAFYAYSDQMTLPTTITSNSIVHLAIQYRKLFQQRDIVTKFAFQFKDVGSYFLEDDKLYFCPASHSKWVWDVTAAGNLRIVGSKTIEIPRATIPFFIQNPMKYLIEYDLSSPDQMAIKLLVDTFPGHLRAYSDIIKTAEDVSLQVGLKLKRFHEFLGTGTGKFLMGLVLVVLSIGGILSLIAYCSQGSDDGTSKVVYQDSGIIVTKKKGKSKRKRGKTPKKKKKDDDGYGSRPISEDEWDIEIYDDGDQDSARPKYKIKKGRAYDDGDDGDDHWDPRYDFVKMSLSHNGVDLPLYRSYKGKGVWVRPSATTLKGLVGTSKTVPQGYDTDSDYEEDTTWIWGYNDPVLNHYHGVLPVSDPSNRAPTCIDMALASPAQSQVVSHHATQSVNRIPNVTTYSAARFGIPKLVEKGMRNLGSIFAQANIGPVIAGAPTSGFQCYGLAVKDNIVISVGHLAQARDWTEECALYWCEDSLSEASKLYRLKPCKSTLPDAENRDVSFWKIENLPQNYPDIVNKFMHPKYQPTHRNCYLERFGNERHAEGHWGYSTLLGTCFSNTGAYVRSLFISMTHATRALTTFGDCGLPWYAASEDDGGNCILGIHNAGNYDGGVSEGICAHINREELADACAKLTEISECLACKSYNCSHARAQLGGHNAMSLGVAPRFKSEVNRYKDQCFHCSRRSFFMDHAFERGSTTCFNDWHQATPNSFCMEVQHILTHQNSDIWLSKNSIGNWQGTVEHSHTKFGIGRKWPEVKQTGEIRTYTWEQFMGDPSMQWAHPHLNQINDEFVYYQFIGSYDSLVHVMKGFKCFRFRGYLNARGIIDGHLFFVPEAQSQLSKYTIPGKITRQFCDASSLVPYDSKQNNETVQVVGCFPHNFSHKPTSSYVPTPWSNKILNILDYGKIPRKKDEELSREEQDKLALDSLGRPSRLATLSLQWARPLYEGFRMNPDLKKFVISQFTKHLIANYPEMGLLSDYETLNGITPSSKLHHLSGGLDKLETHTSAGWTAQQLFGLNRKDDIWDVSLEGEVSWISNPAVDAFRQFLNEQLQKVLNGECYFSSFLELEKYEKLKPEKAYLGRTFCADDAHSIYIERKVLGLFCAQAMLNDKYCGVGIDVVAHGDLIYRELAKHPHVFTGDYKQFDRSEPSELFSVILECFSQYVRKDYLPVLRAVFHSILIRKFQVSGNALLFMNGGLPSGLFATAPLNSLVNLLITYTSFVVVCLEEGLPHMWADFADNVSCITYGDDLAVSVSEQYKKFNRVSMSRVVKDLFGMQLDTANKDGYVSEFDSMETVQWISRFFRSSRIGPINPLKKPSIQALLHWTSDLSPEQMIAQLNSCWFEAALWGAAGDIDFYERVFECVKIALQYLPDHSQYLKLWTIDNALDSIALKRRSALSVGPRFSCAGIMMSASYSGELNTLFVEGKISKPVYEYTFFHDQGYKCVCTCTTMPDQKGYASHGIGMSKKEAKNKAAEQMLIELGYLASVFSVQQNKVENVAFKHLVKAHCEFAVQVADALKLPEIGIFTTKPGTPKEVIGPVGTLRYVEVDSHPFLQSRTLTMTYHDVGISCFNSALSSALHSVIPTGFKFREFQGDFFLVRVIYEVQVKSYSAKSCRSFSSPNKCLASPFIDRIVIGNYPANAARLLTEGRFLVDEISGLGMCPHCMLVIDNFLRTEDLLEHHRKESPQCAVAHGKYVSQVNDTPGGGIVLGNENQDVVPSPPLRDVTPGVGLEQGWYTNTSVACPAIDMNPGALSFSIPETSGQNFTIVDAMFQNFFDYKVVSFDGTLAAGAVLADVSLDPRQYPSILKWWVSSHSKCLPMIRVRMLGQGTTGNLGSIRAVWLPDMSKTYSSTALAIKPYKVTTVLANSAEQYIIKDIRGGGYYRDLTKPDEWPWPGIRFIVDTPLVNVNRNDPVALTIKFQICFYRPVMPLDPPGEFYAFDPVDDAVNGLFSLPNPSFGEGGTGGGGGSGGSGGGSDDPGEGGGGGTGSGGKTYKLSDFTDGDEPMDFVSTGSFTQAPISHPVDVKYGKLYMVWALQADGIVCLDSKSSYLSYSPPTMESSYPPIVTATAFFAWGNVPPNVSSGLTETFKIYNANGRLGPDWKDCNDIFSVPGPFTQCTQIDFGSNKIVNLTTYDTDIGLPSSSLEGSFPCTGYAFESGFILRVDFIDACRDRSNLPGGTAKQLMCRLHEGVTEVPCLGKPSYSTGVVRVRYVVDENTFHDTEVYGSLIGLTKEGFTSGINLSDSNSPVCSLTAPNYYLCGADSSTKEALPTGVCAIYGAYPGGSTALTSDTGFCPLIHPQWFNLINKLKALAIGQGWFTSTWTFSTGDVVYMAYNTDLFVARTEFSTVLTGFRPSDVTISDIQYLDNPSTIRTPSADFTSYIAETTKRFKSQASTAGLAMAAGMQGLGGLFTGLGNAYATRYEWEQRRAMQQLMFQNSQDLQNLRGKQALEQIEKRVQLQRDFLAARSNSALVHAGGARGNNSNNQNKLKSQPKQNAGGGSTSSATTNGVDNPQRKEDSAGQSSSVASSSGSSLNPNATSFEPASSNQTGSSGSPSWADDEESVRTIAGLQDSTPTRRQTFPQSGPSTVIVQGGDALRRKGNSISG